jgi:hypothetical protein
LLIQLWVVHKLNFMIAINLGIVKSPILLRYIWVVKFISFEETSSFKIAFVKYLDWLEIYDG